tara:strand:- start:12599 stop:13804 length:1206 start_codon:yes stop_codon:yes gene_type:complete
VTSRSLVAPINLFIVLVGFFFSSIFFNTHTPLVYLVYFSILTLIVLHNLIISGWVQTNKEIKKNHSFKYPNFRILCILSFIFIVFILFINKFDGLIGFILASKTRTEEFYGLGHYKTIINMIYPLGLVSYILYNYSTNKNKVSFIINILIQCLVIFIALLSLSRGTIINYFISIIIIRFLLGYNLSRTTYILIPFIALTFASFYGVVRETLNFDDDSFSLGLEDTDVSFKTTWMEYGIFPIEQYQLYNDINTPSYGLTYITAITNLVPRMIWPNKPDPGGVVFTRDYTRGLYDEFNQYSTGLFPEAMINFGIYGGYVFGVIFFFSLLITSSYIFYKYFLNKFHFKKKFDVFIIAFYSYIFMSLPVLTTSEFTNVITALILKFLTLLLMYLALFIKFSYKKK